RLIAAERHPRDPGGAEIMKGERLAGLVAGVELGAVDSGPLEVLAKPRGEVAGRRHVEQALPRRLGEEQAVLATLLIRSVSTRPAVGIVEPSEDRRLDDGAVGVGGSGLAGAGRDLLREALVRALHVEVSGVLGEQAFQVAFAKDQVMVEALAANTA